MSKPKFKDCCNHGIDSFIGTIDCIEKYKYGDSFKYQEIQYDVYVFKESFYGHEVCLRFGDEEHEYLSPGPITRLSLSSHEHYRKALELITSKGKFIYERK